MMENVPFGRLTELQDHPDAMLLAYWIPVQMSAGYKIKRFTSRKALELFCKDGSLIHAVLKTPTHKTMLVNRNTHKDAR